MEPLAAEVWVTDPGFEQVLLVKHRVRGWVPPGGTVEPGEAPRAAAARELLEETGLRSELLPEPAAVTVRSYRADWSPTLGLSYAAVVGRDVPLAGEQDQPHGHGFVWTATGTASSPRTASGSVRMLAFWQCGRAVGSR